jgi:hypothetical protein
LNLELLQAKNDAENDAEFDKDENETTQRVDIENTVIKSPETIDKSISNLLPPIKGANSSAENLN